MVLDYLDYDAIGRRIKIARIKKGITQDIVAEKLNISSTHVSNIETGHSKLSLPVIVGMANILSTSVDMLLCDSVICSGPAFKMETAEILHDCSDDELRVLTEIVKGAKAAIRRNTELHVAE